MSVNKVIIGVLVVVSLALVGFLIAKNQQIQAKNDVIASKDDQIIQKINEVGQLEAQNRALVVDKRNLIDNIETLGIDKNELKDRIGSMRNLIAIYEAQIQSSGSGEVEDTISDVSVTAIDSVSGTFDFSGESIWTNNYLSLEPIQYSVTGKYEYRDGNIIFSDLSYNQNFFYLYELDYTTTTYWKRDKKWQVWKPKYAVTDLTFSDPKITVTGSKSIVTKPKDGLLQKKWVYVAAGLAGGYFLFR